MHSPPLLRTVACGVGIGLLASSASAVVITISPIDTPDCDPLVLPQVVHELGTPPFPTDELIECISTFTPESACAATDNAAIPNVLLVITNLTPTSWIDLHYVADAPTTFISNDDGLVTGGLAFEIDTVGVNTPLVFESGVADTIFTPGETWHFILQDYGNTLGLAPSLLGSVGAVGAASDGDPVSSGSIIALEIPGPASLALLAIGGLLFGSRRRA